MVNFMLFISSGYLNLELTFKEIIDQYLNF